MYSGVICAEMIYILFVLTQSIEIARAENKPLYFAFLDISAAYDNVNRELLWGILTDEGIGHKIIELPKKIYRDITVEITWEGITSKTKVDVHNAFRQGYLLSPLLLMIYLMNVERRLQEINLGFNLSYKLSGMVVGQRLTGLM